MFDINRIENICILLLFIYYISVAIICDKNHRNLYLSYSWAPINTELVKSTCNKNYIYI